MLELLLALIASLTGIDRDVDPTLMQLAQARSVEISCDGCFNHNGKANGVAEILVWHQGGGELEPERAVQSWLHSPVHRAILLNPAYTRIGCGYTYNDRNNGYYFACVLAAGDSSPPQGLANTAVSLGYSPWLVTLGILLVIAASASRPRRRSR